MSECRCGKATRDDAYVCADCADQMSVALGEVPWLETELETTITRQVRMTSGGGGSRSTEKPVPFHPTAAEARDTLRAILVSWVRFCEDEKVRNSSPHIGLPKDNLPAISRWLLWRVDGLGLHELGPDAVDEITDAVATCRRLIDRPRERQYLGNCTACAAVGHDGRLYAFAGDTDAVCNVCGVGRPADALRAELLAQLEDRICTAAEIAKLSTYLGLKANREQVRKRINSWHRRKQVTAIGLHSEDDPTFRFGTVYALLSAEDAQQKAG